MVWFQTCRLPRCNSMSGFRLIGVQQLPDGTCNGISSTDDVKDRTRVLIAVLGHHLRCWLRTINEAFAWYDENCLSTAGLPVRPNCCLIDDDERRRLVSIGIIDGFCFAAGLGCLAGSRSVQRREVSVYGNACRRRFQFFRLDTNLVFSCFSLEISCSRIIYCSRFCGRYPSARYVMLIKARPTKLIHERTFFHAENIRSAAGALPH